MLVTTIYGDMDDGLLDKVTGVVENANERTSWIEYWLGDELVHRSAHVALKKPLLAELTEGNLSK